MGQARGVIVAGQPFSPHLLQRLEREGSGLSRRQQARLLCQVPNLASHSLAQALQRLPADWQDRYRYGPVLVETFEERAGGLYDPVWGAATDPAQPVGGDVDGRDAGRLAGAQERWSSRGASVMARLGAVG